MSVETIRRIISEIDSIEDLKKVQAMLRARADTLQRTTLSHFRVGQKVYFVSSRTGRKIVGQIRKINQKTISIITDDSEQWKVSASLVHYV
jgi:uncharacterized pyridoxamine 5'-phosphate oxidase family protein